MDVGDSISAGNARWSFRDIAATFDEHIRKSVPMFSEGHDLVCALSDFFLPEGAVITDLGSATGALAGKLLTRHAARDDINLIGIDKEENMVATAIETCSDPRARFVVDDISNCGLETSSLIISYYTLQFVHPRCRQIVFDKVYNSLEWGGAFILFEKVRAPDARFQDISSQIYQDFKLEQQFSESEIISKQRSLKGVLEPFSTQGNLDLLSRAGFVDVMSIMKWVCFEGFLAVK